MMPDDPAAAWREGYTAGCDDVRVEVYAEVVRDLTGLIDLVHDQWPGQQAMALHLRRMRDYYRKGANDE
jgi:hypothetical protein